MTLGEKIATLRKENHYTQEQLAELLQVSRQSISKWESDIAYPETDRLIKMGKLFSCSMDYLLNDEITERQPAPQITPPHNRAFSLHAQLPEKKSKKMIFGMPLYHIAADAHGFFALGLKAKGVFSLGIFSRGIFAFGTFSIGLISGGAFALGGIALGAFAIGILALGAICLGIISMGALSTGCFALGALAIGKYLAVGDEAKALIALGQTEAMGSLYSCIGSVPPEDVSLVESLLDAHVPSLLSWALRLIRPWLFF